MSVERIRKLLHDYHEAWGRGDQEAGTSFYAEDMVVHMGGNGPLSGVYHGRDSFLNDWIGRVNDYVDTWTVGGEGHEDQILLIGDDGVLIMVYEVWTKGDKSVETNRLGFYHFEGDKITECYFSDMNQPEVDAFFGDLS